MSNKPKLYADFFVEQLVQLGYTTCFFLGGGNILHLLDAARKRMSCIAVTHENSAGIAAEYFNVAKRASSERAVAFVTAGPGATNVLSAIGGAWLESRELLVVAGQARTQFLSKGTVRQVGHQEIDGAGMARPVTKASIRIEKPLTGDEIRRLCNLSSQGRKGPVFLEMCLDVAAAEYVDRGETELSRRLPATGIRPTRLAQVKSVADDLVSASRPLFLVGHGVSFVGFSSLLERLRTIGIPVATSWNASDYLDYADSLYAGRPNSYGMRWANAVIQQSDLLVAVGASLGVQQTGFNWEGFVPVGKIVRVDIDAHQINRPNPRVHTSIKADGDEFLAALVEELESRETPKGWEIWRDFIRTVKKKLPLSEFSNESFEGHVDPISAVQELSKWASKGNALVIPCSSGGSYTTVMQAFQQERGQFLTNNKGLASMGYGLAGAIGTSVAQRDKPVLLIEGDGGFAQNLSELGTVSALGLNLKIVIFSNGGYASIRISQQAYFGGAYLGCDRETGLGLPQWSELFSSFGIPSGIVTGSILEDDQARTLLASPGPSALILSVHPDQSFIPKVLSSVQADGSIVSDPIHLMSPPLPSHLLDTVFPYLPKNMRGVSED